MKILMLTTDPELALLRQRALETAGHSVVTLISEKEALEAPAKQGPVDLVLVCHRLPDATARKVIRLFHERRAECKVVYIVHLYGEWPEVEADRYVVGADGPDTLLRVISETGPQATA
jgi:DNA-binding response OmpR family regulator